MTAPRTVWLASYPKSGNTWTRAVLAALTGEAARSQVDINDLADGPIASSRAALDSCLGFASSHLFAGEIDALRPDCDAAIDAALTAVRFRKIHDGLRTGPRGAPIVAPPAVRAAVYLVRDPRDVAVSFAHFADRPPERIVELMADPEMHFAGGDRAVHPQVRQRLGTWSDHVTGWTCHDLFPVAVFRYEDLHADPVGEFGRMAAFAGLDAGRAAVAAAVESARFDRLRAQEGRAGFRERPESTTTFFRRGVVGGWRDELTAALARRIESDHAEVMAGLGYTPDGLAGGLPVPAAGRPG